MGQQFVNQGYEQITVSSTAVGLNPTEGRTPHFALIRTDQPVRWRDDGTDPTAAVGILLLANEILHYDGKVERIKFIRQSSDATLDVSYYLDGGE